MIGVDAAVLDGPFEARQSPRKVVEFLAKTPDIIFSLAVCVVVVDQAAADLQP